MGILLESGVVFFSWRAVSDFGTVLTAKGGVVLTGDQRWQRGEPAPKNESLFFAFVHLHYGSLFSWSIKGTKPGMGMRQDGTVSTTPQDVIIVNAWSTSYFIIK